MSMSPEAILTYLSDSSFYGAVILGIMFALPVAGIVCSALDSLYDYVSERRIAQDIGRAFRSMLTF